MGPRYGVVAVVGAGGLTEIGSVSCCLAMGLSERRFATREWFFLSRASASQALRWLRKPRWLNPAIDSGTALVGKHYDCGIHNRAQRYPCC